MTTATTTLTDFLLARIEEDEGVAAEPVVFDSDAWAGLADRVLAECEAKRRIVEEHYYMPRHESRDFGFDDGNCVTCRTQGPCVTVRLLALPHADHPDYDEAWRP